MRLKNLLFAAAFIGMSATVSATTYAVWPVAGEGEEQIPNAFNGWYNFNHEEIADNGVTVMKCTPADVTLSNASSGWMTEANTFDFSKIANHDLVFDAKIEGAGQWNVRLTTGGPESDMTVMIPADGQYHKVRFNVKNDYPVVYEKWIDPAATADKNIFPFSLVGTGLNAESAIYFTNCRYVESVAMPAITAQAKDITATSAVLNYNVTFPEGYTNTTVTINGATSDNAGTLTLDNLQPKTEYIYTIVAKGDYNGETYTKEETVKFKTLREAGDNPTWYGTTDIDGFTADYSITYNADGTLTVNAEFEAVKPTNPNDRNFHIFVGGDEWLKLQEVAPGVLTGTTASTFTEGSTITWEWYFPVEGGVYQQANTYVVGSENEAPLAIRINATVGKITFNSAEISYEVTAPEGSAYKVYYTTDGAEAKEATSSPIKLEGLAELTEYTYEVYAVLQGDQPVESRHAKVTFKTTAENARDYVYNDLFAAEFKNAFLIGETEADRRSIYVNLPWSVVYKADGTAIYSVDMSAVENVVGLVPQIYWNGHKTLAKNETTGRYEYDFGAQEMDAETAISHFFAYNGGTVDVRASYTKWGQEKVQPVVGDAASLEMSVADPTMRIGDSMELNAVAKDANGYFLPADDITYTSSCDADTFDGNKVTLGDVKGARTITATLGELNRSIELYAAANSNASNIAKGLTGYADMQYVAGGDDAAKTVAIKNVTDDSRTTELIWLCNDTENHYFILDLGKEYYIETVEAFFEGAYATDFTVTLSSEAPSEISDAISTYAETNDKVFTVEGGNTTQHYFTQEPAESHRYVALRTSKALNKDWGIKLRDMKVFASENKPSAVDNIAVEDVEGNVEYFNLQGVRVANPGTGLYIRRQGNKVEKIIVK